MGVTLAGASGTCPKRDWRESTSLCVSWHLCVLPWSPSLSWSSSGCSFPEGSSTVSSSVSTSKKAKEVSGKQNNLSQQAWPMSHWAITHIQFCSLSTIIMLSYRKANTQSLEEVCSVFHSETPKFIEHVALVKVSEFRFISLSTILLVFFFESWMIEKRESENSSFLSGIIFWCHWTKLMISVARCQAYESDPEVILPISSLSFCVPWDGLTQQPHDSLHFSEDNTLSHTPRLWSLLSHELQSQLLRSIF